MSHCPTWHKHRSF